MLSRARFAALAVVGVAAGPAESGIALTHVRRLSEMASTNEDLSEMAASEGRSSGLCLDLMGGDDVGCDMNGHQCMICGHPQPGRGYDGKAVYSSTITPGTIVSPPDYIIRDDCGNHTLSEHPQLLLTPLTKFNQKQSQGLGWTNAYCELNLQKVCVDGIMNRDFLFQGKSLTVPKDFNYDFYYCKYNGWLSKESRTIVSQGFDAVKSYMVDFCEERNKEHHLDSITMKTMTEHYLPGMATRQQIPTPEQARFVGSWTCAMGSADGESTGAGCDMSYCHYTYGEIDPGANSSRAFCVYEDCEGWDPLTGMPVTDEYATWAQHADPAGAKK